jgi:hypothetical protein
MTVPAATEEDSRLLSVMMIATDVPKLAAMVVS